MFEIGASLREARARRQLGYDQIEAETKIRAKYIRCMEDEQFDVLPSGTYVRGFLRTYADYLGLDGQLYVDEYSSRFGDIPDERIARRRERPQQRRNESSNAVLIALAGIVAVGVLLLAAWKLNPSSDRPAAPLPPATPTTTTGSTSQGNPSSFQVQKDQHAAQAKKNHTHVAPAVKAVSLRIDIVAGHKSWLVVRRLSNPKKIVYQNTLAGPGHIGGKVQHDPKGYLITSACNPDGADADGQRQDVRARTGQRAVEGHGKGRRRDPRPGWHPHRLLSASPRPTAAILITGSELLLGLVADRNTIFLAQTLDRLGLELQRVLLVGDSEEEIADGLRALREHAVVITSGGLGPTHDDRTVAAVAGVSGRELGIDEPLRARIAEIMDEYARRRGIPPAEYVHGIEKQALVPRGAHIIFPVGTAPGLVVPWEDTTVVVLPGPPAELAQMWPMVEQHPAATALRAGERLERSLLRVFGVSESVVAHAFAEAGGDEAGTTTTICARRAEVEILVRAPHSASDARLRLVDAMRDRLRADVFSEDERPLAELVLDAARARGATIATAESCTAGLVAARLTDIAGSSDVVVGGVVAYANEIKQAMLGVPAALLEQHGAVSAECAEAMARGALAATGAQLAISTTGIAGPGGGTPEKPVGLVYLHCASAFGDRARRVVLPGDRTTVRDSATTTALHLALAVLR